MVRRFAFLCVSLIALSAPALAQDSIQPLQGLPKLTESTVVPPMPLPLKEQEKRGAQVYYLGRFETLDSWVMVRTGQPEFYYATPDNKALVMGILFNGRGDMLTGEQLKTLQAQQQAGIAAMTQKQVDVPQLPPSSTDTQINPSGVAPSPAPATAPVQAPAQAPVPAPTSAVDPVTGLPLAAAPATQQPGAQQPAPQPATQPAAAPAAPGTQLNNVANTFEVATPAVRLYTDASNATSIAWGGAGLPTFYAFIDPNCPHCQQFLREVETYVTGGKVAVHMIPVGYDDRSRKQAAFALAATDGATRMVNYAKGNASDLPAPDEINTEAVRANTMLLKQWNLLATPMIVYRAGGPQGPVRLIRGRPLDIANAVNDLTTPAK